MQWKNYLGDRSFWSIALRLALPIAFQNLLMSSFSMVDTIMIGQLGGNSVAAVGLAGQLSFLLNVVFFGFTSGAAVFIAQYWGSREMGNVNKTYGLALIGATTASCVFTCVGLFAPEAVLSCLSQDQAAIAEGAQYLRVAALSYPFIAINQVASTLLRSTEQVKLPMYVSMISVLANVVFNAFFMFVLGMGVVGAALGTLISAAIAPVALYLISWKKRNQLMVPVGQMVGWNKEFVKRYVIVSLPVLLNESLWALGTTGYNALYGRLSTEFFAAVTIMRSIESVAYVFFVGMCHACSVIVGKHVGSGDLRQAELDAKRFTLLTPIISVVTGGLMILLRGVILMPFANVGEAVLDYANVIICLYFADFALRNIPYMTIVGVFRAGGDTRTGLMYDIGCVWLFALPMTWIAGMVLKLPYVWVYAIMLVFEDLPKAILCLRRLFSRKWIMPVTGVQPKQRA